MLKSLEYIIIMSVVLFLQSILVGQVLNVPQVIQEQDQWCWAGTSCAILNYYGHNISQCTIAEYTRTHATWHDFGSVNCCTDPSQGCNYWNYNWGYAGSIQDILQNWSVNNYGYGSYLSLSTVQSEIGGGRPFVIRWGWTTGGGHFLVGHGINGTTIYYMDPWFGEGSKIATYSWVVSGSNHTWTSTNIITTNANLVPTTTSLSPSNTIAGSPGFILTVDGTNYATGTVVRWNGADRPTTVYSSTQAQATISAGDVATARIVTVTVFNPTPGGGTSNAQTFTVNNPLPTLSGIEPAIGNIEQTLDIVFTGTNYINGVSSVNVGSGITVNSTTINSSTQLTANITITTGAATGGRLFSVTNSAPGGGASGNQTFTVNNPAPTLSGIAPDSGYLEQTLDIVFTGTNYINGVSSVNVGSGITVNSTTINSSTQLTANITITTGAATGGRLFSVTNSTPGGGASGNQTFTVNDPAPTLSGIAPDSGYLEQTLDVVFTGTNYIAGISSVNVGSGITVNSTIVNGSTQLTVNITITTGATTGERYFSVTNSPPVGGTSGTQTFKVITTVSILLNVREYWNIVSIPLFVNDFKKTVLFPTAISDARNYDGDYEIQETLANGIGYWIKFDAAQNITHTGSMRLTDTIYVTEGWNLIGTLSSTIAASDVIAEPPELITSQFFGYEGTYIRSDSLHPGKGYWIKNSISGRLILSALPVVLASNKIRIVPTSDLPPYPPGGVFTELIPNPTSYALDQNYPNPFNPVTTIKYQLPTDSHISLKVYNALGQDVKMLVNERQDAGYHSVQWNAANIASGIYFYRLHATSISRPDRTFLKVCKVILMK